MCARYCFYLDTHPPPCHLSEGTVDTKYLPVTTFVLLQLSGEHTGQGFESARNILCRTKRVEVSCNHFDNSKRMDFSWKDRISNLIQWEKGNEVPKDAWKVNADHSWCIEHIIPSVQKRNTLPSSKIKIRHLPPWLATLLAVQYIGHLSGGYKFPTKFYW